MFLKRIEMQGFKSFADKTIISFDQPITGIVGPNGCGKSNISDAVRWVLGEQSSRSMRGEKMSDVIFSGSQDRRPLNMAEVTLVFDNSNHILNSDSEDLEVTRRLYRETGEAQYLINHNQVRLKDVVDIFLDTGLGKDSLSIISQGNVVSFAEAKPLERRAIFEEAAGVSKYKKRKMESISKLERTKNNLERSSDILSELEKQVSPLKRQAHKAELYKEKKAQLEAIEISVLVQEIEEMQASIEEAKKTIFDIDTKSAMYEANIQIQENKIAEEKKVANTLDAEISKLQEELMNIVDSITSLESLKTQKEERQKYIIETGSREQKAKETKELLEVAKVEYEDRKARLDAITSEIQLDSENLGQLAQKEFDTRNALEEARSLLQSKQNRLQYLENIQKDPLGNRNAGTRAIMENKNALIGILGVIGQELHAKSGYEAAISEALGGAMYNIVTKDEECARDAIRFLKKNQSGRATFLPLTVCKPRYLSDEARIICESRSDFCGVASEFVECDPIYDPVVESLLNTVLVVKTLEEGNTLSALTKRMYNIVTLDGEVIHRGGSMTGGKIKNATTPITLTAELNEIRQTIDAQSARVSLLQKDYDGILAKRSEVTARLQDNRVQSASLSQIVEVKEAKYQKLKNDLAILSPEQTEEQKEDEKADETIVQLNRSYERRDQVTADIRNKRAQRQEVNADIERKEQQLRQLRKDRDYASSALSAIQVDQGKLETKVESDLQRLASVYQLTFEFAKTKVQPIENGDARQEVLRLRTEIEKLGNINMDAPQQYEEVNDRYEVLKKTIAELTDSRDKILTAIEEMDQLMITKFKTMFNKINQEFDIIFKGLYGGGKARLILEDPTDLLNTGIDIDAQPPGKAVQNNMLFSGGEKSLIALCVLFSILKVKTVPLVILDEVEAALDQSNVERFAQYLHNYTDRTQFIVVTHRPGTMQNCNVLYGVTMQHQGVSQMLRVELRDAIEMSKDAGSEAKA